MIVMNLEIQLMQGRNQKMPIEFTTTVEQRKRINAGEIEEVYKEVTRK